MSHSSRLRRQICLGLGMGLAADLAVPRGLRTLPGATRSGGETAEGVHYKTVLDFEGLAGPEVNSGILIASDGNGYVATSRGGPRNLGTLCRATPGKNLKVLHSFGGAPHDGAYPAARMIEVDGALYGVTTEGGSARGGVVFRLAPDSGYTVLHHFGVAAGDGRVGWGGLLFASDGHFYGVARDGGDAGGGVVFRMDLAGTFTPLWQLGGPGDPATPMAAFIERADGRLYSTSSRGGAHGKGTIFSVAKDGSDRRVLFSFSGKDGFSPQVPLTEADDGGLYGVTTFGGSDNRGTAYRLSADGTFTVLHSFTGGKDGREPNTELLMTGPGVFIGTTTFGGSGGFGSGTVYQIHEDGTYQRLHVFGGTVHGVADGAWPSGPLLLGPGGQVIGSCRVGGAKRQGTIWKMLLSS
jgi:uncharacterized repeat protein (TIGR03803 family)